jgi:hypothetical protein
MKVSQPGATEDYEMGAVNSSIETLLNEHDVARITGLSVASARREELLRIAAEGMQPEAH